MSFNPPVVRRGEYAARGDYHRLPDPDWEFYPTYLAKLNIVRRCLDSLPSETRVLDAGCGEGVLVDEYAGRLRIEGLDPNYSSDRVRTGSLTALPYDDESFDRALCLDVLEHLTFEEQPRALAELHRSLFPAVSCWCRCRIWRTFSRACTFCCAAGSFGPPRS
jgi:ubiquinone/menaquinone biosynthesis C-methylase UbiE